MNPSVQIRRFESRDEPAIRRICFETALFGEPMAPHFTDERLVTHVLLGGYLALEPGMAFVAESDSRIAGYLTGTCDTRRFLRACPSHLGPALVRHVLTHGHLLRASSWAFALAMRRYSRILAGLRARVLDTHPAHFHVNIDRTFRGQGVGSALVRHLLDELMCTAVPGVHLTTASADGPAFFGRMGFHVRARATTPSILGRPPHELCLMTRDLAPAAAPMS